ncbi:MAG: DUF1080 domain-containing protein [Flavobacteriaceae bacterium]|nr:DUF1080 domain-containing protein [Flavobacteriaceae bacterium]
MKNLIVLMFVTFVYMGCKQTTKEKDIVETNTEVVEEMEVTKNSEWIVLFDGTSFDKWRGYLTDEMYSEWTIEEGAMVYTPGEKGGKNIISKQKFTNFVLSLEWKISEGGNSGIFWSVHEDKKFPEAYQTGPEIQVLDNAKHPDAKVGDGTHKAGSLYDMIACPDEAINPAGEWNLCILEINHEINQGKVSMNGSEVMTFPIHGEAWDNMVSNSKFNGWEGFGKYQTGHIGLQDHGDKVWYRNIKIKEL